MTVYDDASNEKNAFIRIDNEKFAFVFGGRGPDRDCLYDVLCFRQQTFGDSDNEANEYIHQVTPRPSPSILPIADARAVTVDRDIYVTGGYMIRNDYFDMFGNHSWRYDQGIFRDYETTTNIVDTDIGNTGGFQVYKSDVDRWLVLPSFGSLAKRSSHGSCILERQVLVVGGFDDVEANQAAQRRLATSTQVLDTRTVAWRQAADTNDPHAKCTAAVTVLDSIYVLGGDSQSVEQYDAAADRWRRVAPMLHTHTEPSVFVFRDEIYVIGCGCNCHCRFSEKYSPKTDSWTRIPDLPLTWHGGATFTNNGRIYCLGGLSYLDHHWARRSFNLQMNEGLGEWTISNLEPLFRRSLFALTQLSY